MCILLVEDEALILEIMAETLDDAGYDIKTATDGPMAMALVEQYGSHFSALFSDFHLPGGLTGLDVAARMRSCKPALPVILATGRPDVLDVPALRAQKFVLLRKPYGPAEMLAILARLVAPHRPRPGGLRTT